MVLSATPDTPNPLGFNYQAKFDDEENNSTSTTLNVNETISLTMFTQMELLELMSPSDGTSLFYKVVTANGLSQFAISFDRKALCQSM